ncbi:hypothetical protein PoB_003100100 [Plakobranchus ocellatus]|uniref:Uncharacterized protein n=1 Tax=Plakobranchus ocellatus TaxID=259542 RepID=A0AAV3ZZT8_9GAST|nr:hypothetical protein PoB_003100100 [Plakobranchus ocellatus]
MANYPATQPPTVPYKRAPKRKATSTAASVVDEEILKILQKPENDDGMWAKSLIPSLQKLRHLEKLVPIPDLFEKLNADDNGRNSAKFVQDAHLIFRGLVRKPEPMVQAPGEQDLDVDLASGWRRLHYQNH